MPPVVFGLLPAIVMWIFPENRGPLLHPAMLNIIGFGALLTLFPKSRTWRGTPPLVLFVGSFLAVLWLLSERADGRTISIVSLPILTGLAGVGTSWLITSRALKREHVNIIIAAALLFSVAYFSGSTGGGDKMARWYTEMGVSNADLRRVVYWTRKVTHFCFYGCLAHFSFRHFLILKEPRWGAFTQALLLVILVSSFDEWRQSLMPNRTGQFKDVILDLTGACCLLTISALLSRKREQAHP